MIPTLADLIRDGGFACPDCHKKHEIDLRNLILARGAIDHLPEVIRQAGGTRVFLIADPNTWDAAGKRAAGLLTEAGLPVNGCVLPASRPPPMSTPWAMRPCIYIPPTISSWVWAAASSTTPLK